MTIAYDNATGNSRTVTTDPYSFSHTGRATGSGGVQGVAVILQNYTSATNQVAGVTYGGVALTKMVEKADSAGETTNSQIWFAGSGLTGGTQTVEVDFTSATTDDFWITAVTLTAAKDLLDAGAFGLIDDQANPTLSISAGAAPHTPWFAVGGIAGGLAAITDYTPDAGLTAMTSQDTGQEIQRTERTTSEYNGGQSFGYTAASDDVSLVVLIVYEEPTPTTVAGTTTFGSPTVITTNPNATVTATTVAGAATVGQAYVAPARGVTVAGTATVGAPTFTSSAAVAPGRNFLPAAAEFDGNITGWVTNDGTAGSVSYSTTQSYSSPGSLFLNSNTGDRCIARTPAFPLRRETVTVSFWMYSPNNKAIAVLSPGPAYDAGGQTVTDTHAGGANTWQFMEFTFDPATFYTGDGTFRLKISGTDLVGGADHYIDNVQIEYSATSTAWVVNTAVPCTVSIPQVMPVSAPGTVQATTAVATPTIITDSGVTVFPATVAATGTVDAPTLAAGALVSVSTASGATTVGAPGITLVAGVSTVVGAATVAAPSISQGSVPAVTTVASVATVGSPTIRLSVVASPTVVTGATTIAAAGLSSAAAPATVSAVSAVGIPVVNEPPRPYGIMTTALTFA